MTAATEAHDEATALSDFLDGLAPPRSEEAPLLMDLMARVTGAPARLWNGKIVGFGRYAYTYASGHSGTTFITGFAPAKARLSIHVLPSLETAEEPMTRLGPHKHGVSCLYITRLARVDLAVLEEIVAIGVARVRAMYPDHGLV